ncbi:hypothetical protein CERSUDRAFT_90308 [Gelatoporia subvermispora B]|uniref:Ino eighty subunit 1 n=1 Tax=Ceriporiopsis subvermispora (strain B) TaxID=914234 RepID=M2PXU5_CERS8|nr:hypothetical protein CERSUDRAFT_90308 [Gelatoporia subvermispora B]
MPNPTPAGTHRKHLAVKHYDGEPLTRVDLQYDFLHHLFTDPQAVFTDPYKTLRGDPPGSKVTFRDLYVNSLVHSPRCSRALRDKLVDTPEFGSEFAMMSLLSNVGRINTTMAFFPEMRTALRTYHPVPSLQKTDGNLQDAPRIKNILKSCLLENESQGTYCTPADVLNRSRTGHVPPTSIVNLIFVFASHATTIARTHFEPHTQFDFLDFFTPIPISSETRARAFLWLVFHYHEAPAHNPFSDEHSEKNPDKVPALTELTTEGVAAENVDPPDEKEWADKMTRQRAQFVESKEREEAQQKAPKEKFRFRGTSSRGRGRGRGVSHAESSSRPRDPSPADSAYDMPQIAILPDEDMIGPSRIGQHPVHLQTQHSGSHEGTLRRAQWSPEPPTSPDIISLPRVSADPYPRRQASPPASQSSNGQPVRSQRRRSREPRSYSGTGSRATSTPSIYPSSLYPPVQYPDHHYAPQVPELPHRSMLEHAWHVVMTTDPLVDSDEEEFADENTRLDYVLRLRIINRLRGKEPTPEPEPQPLNGGVHPLHAVHS